MTQTKYQKEWYLRNKNKILEKEFIKTKQNQESRKRIVVCASCGKEFITSHSKIKYCENPECKKKANSIRHTKFKENNKEHLSNYYKDRYKADQMVNRELRKLSSRKRHLKIKYGMSMEDYDRRVNEQDGRCVICGEVTKELHVDHDHKTNKVRSLLCFHCNAGLGHFKDDISLLNSAIGYLTYHK